MAKEVKSIIGFSNYGGIMMRPGKITREIDTKVPIVRESGELFYHLESRCLYQRMLKFTWTGF